MFRLPHYQFLMYGQKIRLMKLLWKVNSYFLTQETSATTINASTDSTALQLKARNFHRFVKHLNYVGMYGLTETLINRLSDDELDYAKVSFHFVNQDISGTARMITKLYGEKPIPEDSYSTDYSTLTIDDLKIIYLKFDFR